MKPFDYRVEGLFLSEGSGSHALEIVAIAHGVFGRATDLCIAPVQCATRQQ